MTRNSTWYHRSRLTWGSRGSSICQMQHHNHNMLLQCRPAQCTKIGVSCSAGCALCSCSIFSVCCCAAEVRSVAAEGHRWLTEASMMPSTSGKLLLLACFLALSHTKSAGTRKPCCGCLDGLVSVSGDCSRPSEQQPAALQGGVGPCDDNTPLKQQLCLYEEMFDRLIDAVHRWREEKIRGLQATWQPSHVGEEDEEQVADNTTLRHQLCLSEEEFAYVVAVFNATHKRQASNCQATSQPRQVGAAEENPAAADAALRHQLCLAEEEFARATGVFDGLRTGQVSNCQATSLPLQGNEQATIQGHSPAGASGIRKCGNVRSILERPFPLLVMTACCTSSALAGTLGSIHTLGRQLQNWWHSPVLSRLNKFLLQRSLSLYRLGPMARKSASSAACHLHVCCRFKKPFHCTVVSVAMSLHGSICKIICMHAVVWQMSLCSGAMQQLNIIHGLNAKSDLALVASFCCCCQVYADPCKFGQ